MQILRLLTTYKQLKTFLFLFPTSSPNTVVCQHKGHRMGLVRNEYARSYHTLPQEVHKTFRKHTHICRVGQNSIYTPYVTVSLVISLPKIPDITPYSYGSDQPYIFALRGGCGMAAACCSICRVGQNHRHIRRVDQNRICAPYMTVYLVIPCPKYLYYTVYMWFWPTLYMYTVFIIYSIYSIIGREIT